MRRAGSPPTRWSIPLFTTGAAWRWPCAVSRSRTFLFATRASTSLTAGTISESRPRRPAQKADQAFQDRVRVRRAARYVQIHGQHTVKAVVHLGMADIGAARDGAGSDREDDLG